MGFGMVMALLPKHSPERLHDFFTLDHATGELRWKVRPVDHFRSAASCHRWNLRFSGKRAGSRCGQGYIRVGVDSFDYAAHRVVFAMTHGHWPLQEIDHRNRQRADNRPKNLRDVSHKINMQNVEGRTHEIEEVPVVR